MLGGLVAFLLVYAVSDFPLGIVLEEWGFGAPLEQCVTKQAVLNFLDGKTVPVSGSMAGSGLAARSIKLRKEGISNLGMRSDGDRATFLRFNFEDAGHRYHIE